MSDLVGNPEDRFSRDVAHIEATGTMLSIQGATVLIIRLHRTYAIDVQADLHLCCSHMQRAGVSMTKLIIIMIMIG